MFSFITKAAGLKPSKHRSRASADRSARRHLMFEPLETRLLLCHGGRPPHGECGGGGGPGADETTYTVVDLGTLGGDFRSSPSDINGSGHVVGSADTSANDLHAFLLVPEDTDADGNPDLWFRDSDGDGANDLMIDLGTFGGDRSEAWGINDVGQVVGEAQTSGGNFHAFLITPEDVDGDGTLDWFVDSNADGANDLMIDLGSLGGDISEASGINDAGQVVGLAQTSGGNFHAFLITPEVVDGDGTLDWFVDANADGANDLMIDLGSLGGDVSRASGINDAGQVVGEARTSGGNTHAFLITPEDVDVDGTLDWFVDTNDDGVNDLMVDLGTLGGSFSHGSAINVHGHVAGHADDSSQDAHAADWQIDDQGNVTINNLGIPGGFQLSLAEDINDAGQIVGHAGKTSGPNDQRMKTHAEPYLWQAGTTTALEKVVSDMGGFDDLDFASGINGSGLIIGAERIGDHPTDPLRAWIALPNTTSSSSTASSTLLALAFENSTGDTSSSDGGSGDTSPLFVEETTAVDYAPPTGNRRPRAHAVDSVMTAFGGESGSAADTRFEFDSIGDDLLEDLVVAQL